MVNMSQVMISPDFICKIHILGLTTLQCNERCCSYCVKILSLFYDNLDTSVPNDPEVIIKIDISNVFNTTCRALTLDVLSGHTSRDYACGLKKGDDIPTCEKLSDLFGYFKVMRTCHDVLRYFDWDG